MRTHHASIFAFVALTALPALARAQQPAQRPTSLPSATAGGTPVRPTHSQLEPARRDLASPAQATRAAAAMLLRTAHAADPTLGAAVPASFARLQVGLPVAEFERSTRAEREGATPSSATIYRLDDYWVVTVTADSAGRVRSFDRAERDTRRVWVAPPANYTGHWVTYFVNGAVANEIEYQGGRYARFRAFYDNGQLTYEQRYANGEIDGDELGFYRDGRRMYEIHHARGQNVGRWIHWFQNGNNQSEEHYEAGQLHGAVTSWRENGSRSSVIVYRRGQETGQAAWNEQGRLEYARGAAAEYARER